MLSYLEMLDLYGLPKEEPFSEEYVESIYKRMLSPKADRYQKVFFAAEVIAAVAINMAYGYEYIPDGMGNVISKFREEATLFSNDTSLHLINWPNELNFRTYVVRWVYSNISSKEANEVFDELLTLVISCLENCNSNCGGSCEEGSLQHTLQVYARLLTR